jgi:2-polyprenyl-6-methoxyphenol hydroxylase-like FAD-dependent oxidoreductase
VTDVPDVEKPETWSFQVVNNWTGKRDESLDNAGRIAQVKELASDLKEPFASAIKMIPDDTELTYDNIGYWISKQWDNKKGTVTLAGDAAHPMPPRKCATETFENTDFADRGQGLNHAINDVANLVAALKKVASGELSQEKAISEYEEEVIKRGADEVAASKQTADYLLGYHKIMESALMKQGMARNSVS